MASENLIKLPLKEPLSYFSQQTVGVDVGQSLSKLAYVKDNELYLSINPTQNSSLKIREFLESIKNMYSNLNFTGGKSYGLYQQYSGDFNTRLLNEFEANVKGVEIFYLLEKKKTIPDSLVVSIGTGTSIVLKTDIVDHLGGTAMGGGFFMGLIKALFNINDFQEAIDLAKEGNRYNIDLKVSDIYSPEDNRIDLIFREFTAASLGKIDLNFNINNLKKEDFINSIICMIGENIGTIANLMAVNNSVSNIVFCGGFLRENRVLTKILSLICRVNKNKAIFLKNSEFSAALGALCL
ncbi:MAG: hypothetical protein ACFFB0_10335 [Promethearchaeota archaeon]